MTSFKLFAGTDIGLRDNNEDNFTVNPDLTKGYWIVPADVQETIQLGQYGCLLVVADGMGGQNAGEVASAIAIDTVHDLFATEKLTEIVKKPDSINSYLKKVIVEADQRVKYQSSRNDSTLGMGSTIVLVWLFDGMAHVAWLGDSRAYSIVPGTGITRLTKDHSYVQKLVDSGVLTEDEAMDHPDSNIITKSLGDTSTVAKPDVASFPLTDNEVILLCSDGLCGVCHDTEIAYIVEEHKNNLQRCKEVLTEAALNAGGSDNITIALAHVFNDASMASNTIGTIGNTSFNNKVIRSKKRMICFLSILCLLLFILSATLFFISQQGDIPLLEVDKTELNYAGDYTKFHVIGKSKGYIVTTESNLITINIEDSLITQKDQVSNDTIVLIQLKDKHDVVRDSVNVGLMAPPKPPTQPQITPIKESMDAIKVDLIVLNNENRIQINPVDEKKDIITPLAGK